MQIEAQAAASARFVDEACEAGRALGAFTPGDDVEFVSLGQHCCSAWYLKQAGLKRASYPFDWIFSSPAIVQHCLEDGFATLLDKASIRPKPGGHAAGHALYHAGMFNHRNPLRSDEDHAYLRRACARFEALLASPRPVVFVMTLVNEPAKRVGWAGGFGGAFPMPVHQDLDALQPLFDTLRRRRGGGTRFVVIDPYTHAAERRVAWRIAGADTVCLRFEAGGDSTGMLFKDPLDDLAYRLLFTGLAGARHVACAGAA